jgi:hypothetical protein
VHFDLTWTGADEIAGRYAYVAVDGEDGYYADLVTLGPQPLGFDFVLSSDAGPGEHVLVAALDDGTGSANSPEPGPFFSWPISIAAFGDTDVLVSLSWATEADVDLHVRDPSGDEVSWETPVVASGGELDNDGASNCGGDAIRTEDVYWPADTAPSGTYAVFLDYYDDCGAELTDYQVTVALDGGDPTSFAGSFGSRRRRRTRPRRHRVRLPMTILFLLSLGCSDQNFNTRPGNTEGGDDSAPPETDSTSPPTTDTGLRQARTAIHHRRHRRELQAGRRLRKLRARHQVAQQRAGAASRRRPSWASSRTTTKTVS